MDLSNFKFDSNANNGIVVIFSITLILASIVGLMFVVVGGWMLANTLRWEFNSQEVTGRVVSTRKYTQSHRGSNRFRSGGMRFNKSHARNMGPAHRASAQVKATVNYELDGVEYTATTRSSLKHTVPRVGDEIRLSYLPSNPSKARQIRSRTGIYVGASIGIAVGCSILMLARIFMKKLSRSRAVPPSSVFNA